MLRTALIVLSVLALCFTSCKRHSDYNPKAGDILFQDLASPQSEAIKLATESQFSHCGIVFEEDGKFVVFEAVGPVRMTPLDDWIAQGVDAAYEARRPTPLDRFLTPAAVKKMREVAEGFLGRPYDFVFNWSNEELYCSELVWKVYYEGFGLELTPLRRLGSYDLSSQPVKEILTERYGNNIPLDEPAVSPGDLFESRELYTVY